MGSNDVADEPPHAVTISKGFYMSDHTVTRKEWFAVMATRPWLASNGSPYTSVYMPPAPESDDDYPANVSWHGAMNFVQAKNGGSSTGLYRLPTEAEWEYACRFITAPSSSSSITNFAYPFATPVTAQTLDQYAWFFDNSENVPHPVKTTAMVAANGLWDIHGNVGQWVLDWYYAYQGDQTDPVGPCDNVSNTNLKVLRGGTYHSLGYGPSPDDCRATARGAADPSIISGDIGFRYIRMLSPGPVFPSGCWGGVSPAPASSSGGGGGGGGCFVRTASQGS
jgi:formylglycine-generating enzyme required for sulfatase activity